VNKYTAGVQVQAPPRVFAACWNISG